MKKHDLFNPAITLGTNIAAGMFVFAGIGYYLDNKFNQEQNLYTLGGLFLGLIYCGYEIWKIVKKTQKEEADNNGSSQQ